MPKILVIDDEKDYREMVVIALRDAGYEMLEAGNGTTGIELAQRHKPDMILCDLMMPGISGYETLAAIRKEPVTAKIPVVFLTAFTDTISKERGDELGMDGYLSKPVPLSQLLEVVRATLERSGKVLP